MIEYMTLSIVAIVALVLQSWLFMKERKSLLNRLMARNYEQFQYYEQMFKGEVEELKKDRDEVREEKTEDDEIKKEMDLKYKKEKKFIEGTDEDWEEEDIDFKKLREKINEK